MEILRECGIGTNIHRLLHCYWDEHKVVPKARRDFGRLLRTERGVTQGDLVSLTIFNIVVNTVVRSFLLEVCGPQEAHNGFGLSASEIVF